MTNDGRYHIEYWCETWPGAKEILHPDQLRKWGWTYKELYLHRIGRSPRQLYATVDVDPESNYHFLLQFQWTQSMSETVLSLPARTHIPHTGKNTWRVPLRDLFPTLDVVGSHKDYVITVHQDVELLYEALDKEDAVIKSLSEIDSEDAESILAMKDLIAKSKCFNRKFEFFPFQVAGIAMCLHVLGSMNKLVPGRCEVRLLSDLQAVKARKAKAKVEKLKQQLLAFKSN